MAQYISAHLKRMHFCEGYTFKFQEGLLVLEDPQAIEVLDREIARMRENGQNPGMSKVEPIVVIPPEPEVEVEKATAEEPKEPADEIELLAEKYRKGNKK